MKKGKHQKDLDKVEEFKARFSKQDTDDLKRRLNTQSLVKEASAAIRQILQERGEL